MTAKRLVWSDHFFFKSKILFFLLWGFHILASQKIIFIVLGGPNGTIRTFWLILGLKKAIFPINSMFLRSFSFVYGWMAYVTTTGEKSGKSAAFPKKIRKKSGKSKNGV